MSETIRVEALRLKTSGPLAGLWVEAGFTCPDLAHAERDARALRAQGCREVRIVRASGAK